MPPPRSLTRSGPSPRSRTWTSRNWRRPCWRPASECSAPGASVPGSLLLSPPEIRQLADRLGVKPAKRLGQNFVIDGGTIRKIVALADPRPDDLVLEVGPGLGSLTLGLLGAGSRVTAIEIDPVLAAE